MFKHIIIIIINFMLNFEQFIIINFLFSCCEM